MTDIVKFIDHLEYPNVNGIVFPDGRIQLAALSREAARPLFSYHSELKEITSIEAMDSHGVLDWSSGVILGRGVSDDGTMQAVSGEGNWGSDGFVALINNATQKLVWLAAFQCSNPFGFVEFKEGWVCAESTLGHLWRFPLSDPCQFKIK